MIRKLARSEYGLIIELARTLKKSLTVDDFGFNDEILVFEENSSILGFICYSRLYETIDILYIVVNEEYRRKGIATKLVGELLNIEGVKHILLEVNKENTGAIEFYNSLGFNVIREIKNYYNNQDAFAMERVI